VRVKASDIKRLVQLDQEPDASYANAEGYEAEKALIDSEEWLAYGCSAFIDLKVPYGPDHVVVPIMSPGLWNIFAKSEEDAYFDEVFEEEKAGLIDMLRNRGLEVEE